MKCEKCVSYEYCNDKGLLLDVCCHFFDKTSIVSIDNINILNCPFCGRNAVMVKKEENGVISYGIRCSEAHCAAKTDFYNFAIGALERWNGRNEPILRLEHWR